MMSSSITHIPFAGEQIGNGSIYRSAAPSERDIERYRREFGITTVVQLCEDREVPHGTLAVYQALDHNRFLIKDSEAPADLAETRKIVQLIVDKSKDGKKVLVHCRTGLGRTTLVLACVAHQVFNLGREKSVEFVKRYIPSASLSSAQIKFLDTFCGKDASPTSSSDRLSPRPSRDIGQLNSFPISEESITPIPFPEDKLGSGKIIRCKMPAPSEIVKYQKEHGITTVVQLCTDAEFAQYGKTETLKTYEALGLNLIKFPIADFSAPKKDEMQDLLAKIIDAAGKGENILIHCYAGHGRTGMVLSCLARQILEQSTVESIAFIKKLIPSFNPTLVQSDFIRNYLPEAVFASETTTLELIPPAGFTTSSKLHHYLVKLLDLPPTGEIPDEQMVAALAKKLGGLVEECLSEQSASDEAESNPPSKLIGEQVATKILKKLSDIE